MSIVSNKLLPMSLDDIVEAIQSLQATVDELTNSTSDSDSSALEEKINELQAAFDSFSSLEERVSTLEATIQDLSDSDSSDESEFDLQDISDRVEALENTTNDFFGA